MTWNLPLTDPPSCPGCCSPNWLALNSAVQAVRTADGNAPTFSTASWPLEYPWAIIGCNSGGVSTGSVGDGVTMAHELGHACGRPHSPCGTPGDPAYPAYEPYDPAGTPTASLGEYGIDISNGAIKPPGMFKDFMSYCGPSWVSLFVYGRLTDNSALDPVRACVDRIWWRDEILYERQLIPEKWLPNPPPDPSWLERVVLGQPAISIIGVLRGPDDLEVQSVFRLTTETTVQHGRALDLRAELVSADGRVVGSAAVYSLRSHANCGCGGDCDDVESYPRLVQAFVPDVEAGALLRIQRGGEAIWQRAASPRKPKIGSASAKLAERELHLTWSVEASGEQEPACWAQWSSDRGRTWHALGVDLHDGAAVLDARVLPSGSVGIRLLVSDGFHTATSRVLSVTIPERPAEASILGPRDGQTFAFPGPLRLWGAALDARGEPVPDEAARWVLDGDEVATGLDAFVAAPGRGDHASR